MKDKPAVGSYVITPGGGTGEVIEVIGVRVMVRVGSHYQYWDMRVLKESNEDRSV